MLESDIMERLGKNFSLEPAISFIKENGISFDIDGVESNTAILSIEEYNKLYGIPLGLPKTVEQIEGYFIMAKWLESDPRVKEPYKAAVRLWNSDDVIKNAPID